MITEIAAKGLGLPLAVLCGILALLTIGAAIVFAELYIMRRVFRHRTSLPLADVLAANGISLLVGVILYYAFCDTILGLIGAGMLFDIMRFYVVATVLLTVCYCVGSIVLEGLFLTRRRTAIAAKVGLAAFWKGVVLANIASSVIWGAVFYFVTRPSLPGLDIAQKPAAVVESGEFVYFISERDEHLCRIRANGGDSQDVVPYTVKDFMVSSDHTAFAYRGEDGNLHYYGLGDAEPVLVWQTDEEFLMNIVDIAPDRSMVAFVASGKLRIFDLGLRRETMSVGAPSLMFGMEGSPSWDSKRPGVLHCRSRDNKFAWRIASGTFEPVKSMPFNPVRKHVRVGRGIVFSRGDWGVPYPNRQEKDGLTLRCYPWTGPHIWITKDEELLVRFRDNRGILGLGRLGPQRASFLTPRGEIVCEGAGQLYVLNVFKQRVAELARGRRHMVARSDPK